MTSLRKGFLFCTANFSHVQFPISEAMSTCNKIEKPGKMEYMDRRKVNETKTVLAAQRVEVESKTIRNIPIGINCSCCRYASLGTTK
jgi:hypothetical protein